MIQMVATSVLVSGDARLKILGEHLVQEKAENEEGSPRDANGKEGDPDITNVGVPSKYILKWCTSPAEPGLGNGKQLEGEKAKRSNGDAESHDNDSNLDKPELTLKANSAPNAIPAARSPLFGEQVQGLGLPILTFDRATSTFATYDSVSSSSSSNNRVMKVDPYLMTSPPGKEPLQFLDLSASGNRATNVLYGIFEFEFSPDCTQILSHTIQNVEILNDENKIYDDSGVPCL